MSQAEKERALGAYLVASARTGDRRAMDGLVRLHGPRLFAHAARLLGEREGARDAVQEAWVEILRALPALRDDAAFLPFALRITSRRVGRIIGARQRQRAIAAEAGAQALALGTAEAGEPGAEAHDAARVRAALEALPPAHRATVALFYLEDLTVAEVAAVLDVPLGTIKTRLMHARAKLRALLEPQDGEVS
ncbi:RNA polymerase sigma factor [Pseudoroseicyclus sp. CXY001]|uniref:RNA polymerase sigma factor n=1 Tax=Pseudoroseicyclus sp. CXY001 TaxID=3242492 RepID=UPI0035712C79